MTGLVLACPGHPRRRIAPRGESASDAHALGPRTRAVMALPVCLAGMGGRTSPAMTAEPVFGTLHPAATVMTGLVPVTHADGLLRVVKVPPTRRPSDLGPRMRAVMALPVCLAGVGGRDEPGHDG